MLGITGLALCASASSLAAEDRAWTRQPVRLVVPASPGGSLDQLTRVLAMEMARISGMTVIVENKAGGNGAIGRQAVAAGPLDGTAVFMGQVHEITRAALVRNLSYPMTPQSFDPVAMIGSVPNVLVVPASLQARTVAELIAWAKIGRRQLDYGVGSLGNLQNLAGILFGQQTGVTLKAIPYRGSGPAIVDLIGGQIQALFETMPAALPHIASGKLRALAVTSPQRSPALPDVPTFKESGLSALELSTWYGAFVRQGTPPAITAQLSDLIATSLESGEVQRLWKDAGLVAPPYPRGDAFATFVQAERKRWEALVAHTGAQIEE